jgi:tetratricopeptide repeat protein
MTTRISTVLATLAGLLLVSGCAISPYPAPVVDHSIGAPPQPVMQPPRPSSETIPLESRNDIRPLGPGPLGRDGEMEPAEGPPAQSPSEQGMAPLPEQRMEIVPPEEAGTEGTEMRREPSTRDSRFSDRPREATSSAGSPEAGSPRGSPAVLALLSDAGRQARSGSLDQAAAALERAVRIDPHNATIWSRIAEIRLQQGQPQQAENLAKKSNTLAGRDSGLQARNWHIIAQARRQSGDGTGADAAEQTAADLEGR